MQKLKNIVVTIFALLAFLKAGATGLSFIYIQGDKQVPFYVKVEGEMQPRYGKNYCILSKLAPGPLQIEILFQQNEYPAEKFTIKVPEMGSRGFMLTRKDGVYALYDLQQAFYLSPGNKAEDDMAPPTKAPVPVQTTQAPPTVAVNTPKDNSTYNKPAKNTNTGKNNPPAKPAQQKQEEPQDNGEPKFIPNMELNNERTFSTGETVETGAATTNNETAVANSDCPKPLAFSEYQDILTKARRKGGTNRLKYLLEQCDKCYTTVQVRALTRTLETDPERYAFLKQVFPRVTDQSNFSILESTLQSKEWKQYFKLILP